MKKINCAFCKKQIVVGKYCSEACQLAAFTHHLLILPLILLICAVYFEIIRLMLEDMTGVSIEFSIWSIVAIPVIIGCIVVIIGQYYRFTIPRRRERERINRSGLF